MRNFFCSDTHFGHWNIVRYSKRPFQSIKEHDQTLINNWNKVVAKEDHVYFLGDFCFGGRKFATQIKDSLNGKIFFIEGNHDKGARSIRDQFTWYKPVAKVEVEGQEIWLSHYAHKVWPKSHHGCWHLYGHSHGKLSDDLYSLSIDVGVDCHSYTPISFDEVNYIMNKKLRYIKNRKH
jgi:calcineurin-like phosphoesterase family protein